MNQKGISSILIILIIVGVLVLAGGILFYQYWWQAEGKLTKAEKCYKNLSSLGKSGTPSMPNPATVFCKCMGGEYSIEKTPTGGEKGVCQIEGRTYGNWEYFDKMNPYDNTYSSCPLGYDAWVDFCKKNRNSIYCESYQPETRDETADWQTYRNEEYGYEIKFPKDWYWKHFGKIDERNLDILEIGRNIVSNLGDGDISVTVESLLLKNGFTPKSIETEHELPNFQSKIIAVNGKTAIEYTARTNKDIKGVAILSDPGSKMVYNITTKGEENFIFFDQILSTFKFISQ